MHRGLYNAIKCCMLFHHQANVQYNTTQHFGIPKIYYFLPRLFKMHAEYRTCLYNILNVFTCPCRPYHTTQQFGIPKIYYYFLPPLNQYFTLIPVFSLGCSSPLGPGKYGDESPLRRWWGSDGRHSGCIRKSPRCCLKHPSLPIVNEFVALPGYLWSSNGDAPPSF